MKKDHSRVLYTVLFEDLSTSSVLSGWKKVAKRLILQTLRGQAMPVSKPHFHTFPNKLQCSLPMASWTFDACPPPEGSMFNLSSLKELSAS